MTPSKTTFYYKNNNHRTSLKFSLDFTTSTFYLTRTPRDLHLERSQVNYLQGYYASTFADAFKIDISDQGMVLTFPNLSYEITKKTLDIILLTSGTAATKLHRTVEAKLFKDWSNAVEQIECASVAALEKTHLAAVQNVFYTLNPSPIQQLSMLLTQANGTYWLGHIESREVVNVLDSVTHRLRRELYIAAFSQAVTSYGKLKYLQDCKLYLNQLDAVYSDAISTAYEIENAFEKIEKLILSSNSPLVMENHRHEAVVILGLLALFSSNPDLMSRQDIKPSQLIARLRDCYTNYSRHFKKQFILHENWNSAAIEIFSDILKSIDLIGVTEYPRDTNGLKAPLLHEMNGVIFPGHKSEWPHEKALTHLAPRIGPINKTITAILKLGKFQFKHQLTAGKGPKLIIHIPNNLKEFRAIESALINLFNPLEKIEYKKHTLFQANTSFLNDFYSAYIISSIFNEVLPEDERQRLCNFLEAQTLSHIRYQLQHMFSVAHTYTLTTQSLTVLYQLTQHLDDPDLLNNALFQSSINWLIKHEPAILAFYSKDSKNINAAIQLLFFSLLFYHKITDADLAFPAQHPARVLKELAEDIRLQVQALSISGSIPGKFIPLSLNLLYQVITICKAKQDKTDVQEMRAASYFTATTMLLRVINCLYENIYLKPSEEENLSKIRDKLRQLISHYPVHASNSLLNEPTVQMGDTIESEALPVVYANVTEKLYAQLVAVSQKLEGSADELQLAEPLSEPISDEHLWQTMYEEQQLKSPLSLYHDEGPSAKRQRLTNA